MLFGVSLLATLIGAVAAMFLGWLWYGPLFGKVWAAARGLSGDDLEPAPTPYVVNALGWLIASYVFGAAMTHFPGSSAGLHIATAALLWLGFTLPFMATNGLFAKTATRAIAIDVGYPFVGLIAVAVAHSLI